MILLKGVIKNGEVVLTQPAQLPDGTEVTVCPCTPLPRLGMPDEEWPTDPVGVARLVAHMQSVEPFDMTPAEEAEIERWRQQLKQYTRATQDQAIEGPFE